MIRNEAYDPAFRSLVMQMPSQDELAQALFDQGHVPDPDAIWDARQTLAQAQAQAMQDDLARLYAAHQVTAPYVPDAAQSGARALANATLGLITRLDGGALAARQFDQADNMTQTLAAFGCLLLAGKGGDAVAQFQDRWQHDRLVMDKWFMMQVIGAHPDQTADVAEALTGHPDFTMKTPNRFRAVLGALAGSGAGFHHATGKGYRLLADWLIRLDPLNPQTTARMSQAFETWRRYDPARQALICAELDRILATEGLSRDTTEMITRIRGA